MEIKIDKDVPMPETAMRSTYPFAEMKVGDSFFVEGKTPSQLQNAASHWRKAKGMKFACRAVEEGDPPVKGARIWRVEGAE